MRKIVCTETPFLGVVLSEDQARLIRYALVEEAIRLRTHKGHVWSEEQFCGPEGRVTFSEGRLNNYHRVADLLDYFREALPFL